MTLPRKSAVVLVVLALLLLIVATGTYVSNSSIHLLCVYISFYISSYIYHRTCTYVVYMHVQRPSRRRRRGAPRSTSPSWSHSTWGVRVRPVVRYHCPIPLAALHDVSSEQPTGDSVASSWRFWWWLVRGQISRPDRPSDIFPESSCPADFVLVFLGGNHKCNVASSFNIYCMCLLLPEK